MAVVIFLLLIIGWGFLGAAAIVWNDAPEPDDQQGRRDARPICGFLAATGLSIFGLIVWMVW